MVFEIIRLQLHIEVHTRENKHESGHLITKGAGRHQGRQQGCPTIKGRIVAMKNNSRDYNDQEKNNSRGKQHTEEDQEKHDKRKRSNPNTRKKGWFNLGRRWNHLHGWKNLCAE